MKMPSLSQIAFATSVAALAAAMTTFASLDGTLSEELAAGKPCVLVLVLALWGAILAAVVACYVRPIPKLAWAALAVSLLIVLGFLVMIHM